VITEAGVASGQLLGGRYRLGELIGRGSTAEVYRARDELLDRDVAVKVFRDAVTGDEAMYGAARRETELASLATLNHPHLIRLFDGAVSDDGPSFLVLDLVCGADLATRLHDGPLPEDQVRLVGRQIAEGLDYAHERGMVHRDVKPANILLGEDGPDGTFWARLSDFGTVRMVDRARLTAADLTLGTASYIAPEQARGLDVGPEADVYALGLVLIEALTGERCFADTTPDGLAARLATTPTVPKWVPDDLRTLFTAMTAPEPERRPTAAAVAEVLRGALPAAVAAPADDEVTNSLRAVPADADGPEPPFVIAADAPARRPRRHSNALFALAALAFGAMISGATFLIMNSSVASSDETPNAPQGPASVSGNHHSHTRAANHVSTQPAVLNPVTSVRASTSATHSRHPVLAPKATAPSQVVVSSTTAAPTTSAPPTTSAAPPPTTSAPATSSPPATSAAATSADTSTAAAPQITG
jgi:eukaryotic-like serine/threonine-protein kinase